MTKKISLFLMLLLISITLHAQVNINGLTVNARNGFQYQGGASNNQVLCGNGNYFVPATSCGAAQVTYNQTVNNSSGTSLPQRFVLQFGPAFSIIDGGSYTGINLAATISANTSGNAATATRASSAALADAATAFAATPSQCSGATPFAKGIQANGTPNCIATPGTARTCGSAGCYRIAADGTIEQWGIVQMPQNSGTLTNAFFAFPLAVQHAWRLGAYRGQFS